MEWLGLIYLIFANPGECQIHLQQSDPGPYENQKMKIKDENTNS